MILRLIGCGDTGWKIDVDGEGGWREDELVIVHVPEINKKKKEISLRMWCCLFLNN